MYDDLQVVRGSREKCKSHLRDLIEHFLIDRVHTITLNRVKCEMYQCGVMLTFNLFNSKYVEKSFNPRPLGVDIDCINRV